MNQEVLLLTDEVERYAAALRDNGVDETGFHKAETIDDLSEAALGCEVALAKPVLLCEVLERMPNLRWVQSTYAGVDPLLQPGLPRGYQLTGVKGVFGPLMSEYVLGQIISVERQFRRLDQAQAESRWEPLPYRGLDGCTLGIAGLGSIGRRIAATAGHFGMRVLGYKRSPGEVDGVERVYSGDAFPEFAAAVDYLVLVLPATDETRGLVGAQVLAEMGERAWLINVGRGPVVDQAALVEALRNNVIGGAILDVFEEEPLPSSSPLWRLPNAVVTPHVAAESFPEDIARIFADNWRRYQAGESLLYPIDFERGY